MEQGLIDADGHVIEDESLLDFLEEPYRSGKTRGGMIGPIRNVLGNVFPTLDFLHLATFKRSERAFGGGKRVVVLGSGGVSVVQPYQATIKRLTSGLRIGRRRRSAAVLGVDGTPHVEQRLALDPHACHVTRDVQADGSRRGVAREGQGAISVERLDVAVAIAGVSESSTAARTRDVLQLIALLL